MRFLAVRGAVGLETAGFEDDLQILRILNARSRLAGAATLRVSGDAAGEGALTLRATRR